MFEISIFPPRSLHLVLLHVKQHVNVFHIHVKKGIKKVNGTHSINK